MLLPEVRGRIQPWFIQRTGETQCLRGGASIPGTPRAPFCRRETCAAAGAARSWSWQGVCSLDRAFAVPGINPRHGLFTDPLPVPARTSSISHLSLQKPGVLRGPVQPEVVVGHPQQSLGHHPLPQP